MIFMNAVILVFVIICCVLYISQVRHTKRHTHVGTIEVTKQGGKNIVSLELDVHPENLIDLDKVYFTVHRLDEIAP